MDIAKPPKCEFQVEQIGTELILRRRSDSLGLALFVAVCLTGWTAGCVILTGLVIRHLTLQNVLFAVPFWSSWLLIACLLVPRLFGVEQLRIGLDGLEYRTTALVTLSKRHVPLHEIEGVDEASVVTAGESVRPDLGLKIVTLGRPLRFGEGLDTMERLWLADLLRKHLASHSRPPVAKTRASIEVLHPGGTPPAEPPSDCLIRMDSDWEGAVFVRRGVFRLSTFGVMTFMTLFWNGLISVLAFELFKDFQLVVLVPLIPFGVIGLAIFLGWLATLTPHFRVETWRVSPREVAARVTFFGCGRTRRIESGELGWIALRKDARSRQERGPQPSGDPADETPFSLGFFSRAGHELLAIDDLTEGEGRWIGGHAGEQLKGSLAKVGEHARL